MRGDEVEQYIEMNIDEMKSVKSEFKKQLKTYKRKLSALNTVEETKQNRWVIRSLEMHYNYCIETISEILSIYSNLINLAEDCDLEEDYFIKKIKEVQIIHKSLQIEQNKKNIKEIENNLLTTYKVTNF